ncbi:YggT family protein [Pseudomethylobacillus aquaticus]|uniref:YggT family protein n=1 Tax=Pseudomethylobacillus aquaticus TaxID=2676064 RepID=UPI002680CB61
MSILQNALIFLLHTLFGLFTLAVLLRFYLQLTNAPFRHPASQAIVSLTNFAVRPLRRFVPSWRGLDLSTLLLAFVAQLLLQLCLLWLRDFPLLVAGSGAWIALLGLCVLSLTKLSIYIFLYAVFVQAILSWLSPHNPMATLLDALTRPVLQPLRKHLPLAGGIDISPLVVFIIAELLLITLVTPLEQQLRVLL